MSILKKEVVFSTNWFDIIAKTLNGEQLSELYYSLQLSDYVAIVALTSQQEIILVRQYRPAVEKYTLEWPSGLVDKGELPIETAKRELLEEIGYYAEHLELLGCLSPDTGRLSNKIGCYFVAKAIQQSHINEPGIEVVICKPTQLVDYIMGQTFDHALHLAPLLLAVLKHKLTLVLDCYT